MSKMKKTIPTLVGGAMLLGNTSAFAIDDMSNDGADKQIESDVNKDSLGESSDVMIEIEGDISSSNSDIVFETTVNNSNETDSSVSSDVVTDTVVDSKVEDKVEHEEQVEYVEEEIEYIEEYANILAKERSSFNQKVMKVNKDSVIVRAEENTNAESKGTLGKDELVDVYGKNTTSGWYKINYKGEVAYVPTADLDDIETTYKEAVESGVSVRSGAGTSYSEFGTLAKGDRVEVYQVLNNGWSKVNYNSKIAFVETSKLTDTYILKATVTVDKVKVYKEASVSSEVLGESSKNETLYVYSENGDYYKVKYANGYGYVKKSDLKVMSNESKPQTGDVMIFSYMGAVGAPMLGLVAVNRKKQK